MKWWNRVPRPAAKRSTARHGRHGRTGRSSIVRPPLPPVDTRYERFDIAVGSAAEYLRSAWPELRDVSFEIAGLPADSSEDGIPRWHIDRTAQRIVLFRIPVERLSRIHGSIGIAHADDFHRRLVIEGTVFRAAADYLDRDPWDLAPDRYRWF
ncbi:hypothetical protein N8K70_05855 [Microbacterium betulae]|uniref:Metallopeptidase family protein n=1 Tax=Microbacterium betulae TaxID=2981139 RepID=A0AA97I6T9_9MICO|nr:hypothetical protein [Microbacterium sp. AB]WOF24194.1 hypothetical protein N8K70_05855 [Microbacterium sp. AB]